MASLEKKFIEKKKFTKRIKVTLIYLTSLITLATLLTLKPTPKPKIKKTLEGKKIIKYHKFFLPVIGVDVDENGTLDYVTREEYIGIWRSTKVPRELQNLYTRLLQED